MRDDNETTSQLIASIVREYLDRGGTVELDGMGSFCQADNGSIEFHASTRPRVFIAYVEEDYEMATRVYDELHKAGFEPWMDKRELLPGQNWPRAIERAISIADYFIACFSRRAVSKRGTFQAELRYALDCARYVPLGVTYFIPVRLDNCVVPVKIKELFQYVDLYPQFEAGMKKVIEVLQGVDHGITPL